VPDGPSLGLWTVTEAAAYLRVPASSIYKMTARGARLPIPHVRLAGRLRFRKEDLDEWLRLLTVSNLDTLRRVRRSARRTTDGHDPQAEDGRG
jgi:excisionase family DNA binding protein